MSGIKLSGDLTLDQVDTFLSEPLLARIATASPSTWQPHVVPVWFLWEDHILWIATYAASVKVKDLSKNPRCAVTVDITHGGLRYKGVVVEGKVEIIRQPAQEVLRRTRQIYARYLGEEGVQSRTPQEWLNNPDNVLLKIFPERIKTWDNTRTGLAPLP